MTLRGVLFDNRPVGNPLGTRFRRKNAVQALADNPGALPAKRQPRSASGEKGNPGTLGTRFRQPRSAAGEKTRFRLSPSNPNAGPSREDARGFEPSNRRLYHAGTRVDKLRRNGGKLRNRGEGRLEFPKELPGNEGPAAMLLAKRRVRTLHSEGRKPKTLTRHVVSASK